VPYLRFTRDRRGYEHTYLMHVAGPGERPAVLYWYRTAPGVRVGRPALDEDAIRLIEEQHPNIEFDWSHILEIGALSSPEVEAKVEPRKRKVRREDEPREARESRAPREPRRGPRPVPEAEAEPGESPAAAPEGEAASGEPEPLPRLAAASRSEFDEDALADARTVPQGGLLEELVGIGIATRLRARYAELLNRLHHAPGDAMAREEWGARLETMNPDAWVTPDEVLQGVQNADRLFDQFRREIVGG
jgi:hypothetical protein